MKNLDLSQTLHLLGNAGVIIGIFLLAYELNQNNRHLEEQERYVELQNVVGWSEYIAGDEDAARLFFRSPGTGVPSDQELDRFRRTQLAAAVMRRWEWEFERLDRVEDDEMVQAYRVTWRRALLDDAWAEIRHGFNPNFVRFVDEYVANAQ